MTQYHSNAKQNNNDNAVISPVQEIEQKLNAITDVEIAAFNERLNAFKKEQDETAAKARKEKASAFGRKFGITLVKTAVIATKVAKTAWVGSFELVKTSITLVETAPGTIAQAISTQYKKA